MGKFKYCPACKSEKKGHEIWLCKDCGSYYCHNNNRNQFLRLACPTHNCNNNKWGTAGYVDPNA